MIAFATAFVWHAAMHQPVADLRHARRLVLTPNMQTYSIISYPEIL